MFKRTFIIASCMLISLGLSGQAQIGIHGILTKPMSKFGETNYKDGWGGGFTFFTGSVLSEKYPFKLRFGFGINGSNSVREKFEFETEDPPGGKADYIIKNNNNSAYWAVRLEKVQGKIGLFGDLIYGSRNLHSLEKIRLSDVPVGYSKEDYEEHAHRITESKRVIWGLGLGVNYYLTQNVMLQAYGNYTVSPSFTYLDYSTLEVDNARGILCYEYATAGNSNVLTLHVGMKFNLVGIGRSSSGGSSNSSSTNSSNRSNSSSSGSPTAPARRGAKKKIKIKKKPSGGVDPRG